jgi:hypothetical protein
LSASSQSSCRLKATTTTTLPTNPPSSPRGIPTRMRRSFEGVDDFFACGHEKLRMLFLSLSSFSIQCLVIQQHALYTIKDLVSRYIVSYNMSIVFDMPSPVCR